MIRLPPEDGSVWPETLGKPVSDDFQHFICSRRKRKGFLSFAQTLKGRLPSMDGSDWLRTWPTRFKQSPTFHFLTSNAKPLNDAHVMMV